MITAADFAREWADVPPADDPWEATEAPRRGRQDAPGPGIAERALLRSALATLPIPQPLIAGVLDLGTVAVLAGYWGTLKSFVALDWAACVATGFAWQQRAVTPARALYVAAEGASGLHARLSAWEKHRSTTIPDDRLVTIPGPVNVSDPRQAAELAEYIRTERFGYVTIDTLARCAVGTDENSARDMGLVVDALYRLRDATDGGTVTVAHHTGKDRITTRGSSALESGVDTVYKTDGADGSATLTREKRKDGPLEDVHHLAFVPVEGTGSGVADVRIPDLGTGADGKLFSHFITNFAATGASKAELRASAGLPTASFYRALNALVKDGALINSGTERRPFYTARTSP